MPVMVYFPGGETREVPSRPVFKPSAEVTTEAGLGTTVHEPVPDREWDFTPITGGYRATRKR